MGFLVIFFAVISAYFLVTTLVASRALWYINNRSDSRSEWPNWVYHPSMLCPWYAFKETYLEKK